MNGPTGCRGVLRRKRWWLLRVEWIFVVGVVVVVTGYILPLQKDSSSLPLLLF